jgi:hypothetical protein
MRTFGWTPFNVPGGINQRVCRERLHSRRLRFVETSTRVLKHQKFSKFDSLADNGHAIGSVEAFF